MNYIQGIFPAIPAVFNAEGGISPQEMGRVIEFVNGTKCSGIALNLIGGEFHKLDPDEIMQVMEIGVKSNRSGNLVISGISAPSTIQSCRLADHAQDVGIDVLVAMPPYYDPTGGYSMQAVMKHFITLLEHTDLPMIIQDFNYGVPLEWLLRLSREYSNLCGIKLEGAGKRTILQRVKEIRQCMNPDFSILGGMLGLNLKGEMESGSSGSIPGSSLADFLSDLYTRIRGGYPPGSYYESLVQILSKEVRNLKYFVYSEKSILKLRGIIDHNSCRDPYDYPGRSYMRHLGSLVEELMASDQNSRPSMSGS